MTDDIRRQPQLVMVLAAVLPSLTVCCGCLPVPPSQEEQRQAIPSRWIRTECAAATAEGAAEAGLEHRDAEAIRATVPTVARLVPERLGEGTAVRAGAGVRIQLSGTGADYFQLLADATKAKVIRGRFLTEADTRTSANVIVLEERIANQFFESESAVGQTITVGRQDFTVVGVLSYSRRSQMGDVKRDGFIPVQAFRHDRLQLDEHSGAELDRIWVQVDTLDRVSTTRELIRDLLRQRHPEIGLVVQ